MRVEIDPETGKITLDRYTVVDDIGTVVNPLLPRGQIMGGVAQGAGQALLEDVIHDRDSGQLLRRRCWFMALREWSTYRRLRPISAR